MSSSPRPLHSLFGCLKVLCEHHNVKMSLTLQALDALIAEREGLPAAELALGEAGFTSGRVPLTPEDLSHPDQPFPLLAKRLEGGFVLIIGTKDGDRDMLIGVFDPEEGEARARPWTTDLVMKALMGEALHATPVQSAARPPRDLVKASSAPRSPAKTARRGGEVMADIYADVFENILVHGGVVRIDLASYSPKNKTNGEEPALELTGRLVMPVEGFVRAFGGIGEVVRQMAEAGVIEPIQAPKESR